MTILLLRHGQKKWDNDPHRAQGFDPPLAPEKFPDMEPLWAALCHLPRPRAAVCSPYLRTRQTARMVCEELQLPGFSVAPDMAEFLGHHRHHVSPTGLRHLLNASTQRYRPALFLNRARYVREAQSFPLEDGCWYVTHGLFIMAVAESYGLRMSRPREFSGLLIEGGAARIFDPWETYEMHQTQ